VPANSNIKLGSKDDNLMENSDGAFTAVELAKLPTKRSMRSSDVAPVKSMKDKNKKEATKEKKTAVMESGRELKDTNREEFVGRALAILGQKKSQRGGA
jgi:hypothetical protein